MIDRNDQINMEQSHRAVRAMLKAIGLDPDNLPFHWRDGDMYTSGGRKLATQRFDQRVWEIKEQRAGRA